MFAPIILNDKKMKSESKKLGSSKKFNFKKETILTFEKMKFIKGGEDGDNIDNGTGNGEGCKGGVLSHRGTQ